MKYRLFWSPEAEEKFDSQMLRLEPASQKVILAQVRKMNSMLVDAPYDIGESRFENVRLGFINSLEFLYEVFDDVRTVMLIDVRITKS